jgi:hypothetical protein
MRGPKPDLGCWATERNVSCLIIYLVNSSFVQSVTDIRHFLPCRINSLPSRTPFLYGMCHCLRGLRRGSAAGRIAGSNPAVGMAVCLLSVLCVVR